MHTPLSRDDIINDIMYTRNLYIRKAQMGKLSLFDPIQVKQLWTFTYVNK